MLTDHPKRHNTKSPRNRGLSEKASGKWWSDRQKIEAVTTYFMTGGSISLTSKALKIPEDTLYYWRRTEWWKDLEQDIRKEERLTLSTKLKNIMDLSLSQVEDRLQNGEFIYDQKKGELVRKPVQMKDAGRLAMDAATLRTKLDIHENHTIANEQISEKLSKLAQNFANLSKGIPINVEPVQDIEYKETGEIQNDLSGDSLHGDAEREKENKTLPYLPEPLSS